MPMNELPPVNRDTTSQWVSELREILTNEFAFTHVTESVYASVTELSKTQQIICKRLEKASREGKKTLLFVYYRGNGGLDMRCMDTYAILQNGKAFALEHFLRDLAKEKNTYVWGLLDCPRLRLDYKIEDGYEAKDEGVRNLILQYGCRMNQDLRQPTVWALFQLLIRLKATPGKSCLCLPDDLVEMQEIEFKGRKPKLKYQQDANADALVEEQKKEYLLDVYRNIDSVWDGARPVIIKYRTKAKSRVTIEYSYGLEESDDNDKKTGRNKAEDTVQLTAAQILLKSTMEMREQLHPRGKPASVFNIEGIKSKKNKPKLITTLG